MSDKLLTGIVCPICSKVGKGDTTTDERWADPVHVECVKKLDTWYGAGRNPRGRDGDDTLHDHDAAWGGE